jgi:hypothetical protein
MKQETNKEIDLLLRQLARRKTVTGADVKDDEASAWHMDVDELSSYAENVLPAAARSRYTAHLADCSRCREIVSGLSASFGVVAVEKAVPVVEISPLKKFLATLFSPLVARYAIPTLALVGVVGIGLMVFRQQSLSPLDSNVQTAQTQPAAAKPESSVIALDSNEPIKSGTVSDYRGDQQAKNSPKTLHDSPTESAPPPERKPGDAPTTGGIADDSVAKATPPPPAKVAAADADVARRERGEDDAAKSRAEARQQEAPTVQVSRDREKEVAKRADAIYDGTGAAAAPSGPSKGDSKASADKNEAPAPKATTVTTAGRTAATEAKKKDAGELRSVAGRRFHREGNAWVDTAFEPGRATVNMSRGSEQYRALVADEPEIRTIAEALSGEVVVIWKGRAYRIR